MDKKSDKAKYRLVEQFQDQIDDIIFTTGNSFTLFNNYLQDYKEADKILFLQTVYASLDMTYMENTIEKHCVNQDGILYIYGKEDEPQEKPNGSLIMQDLTQLEAKEIFERTAFNNWYDRKFDETTQILNYIESLKTKHKNHFIYGIDTELSSKQASYLFLKLKGKYIAKLTNEDDFINCFSHVVLKKKPKIEWIDNNTSFYYFMLKMFKFIKSDNYAKLIERNQLFITNKGISFKAKKISSKKSLYTKATNHLISEVYLPPSAKDLDLIFDTI